jgi:hypothetical protein
VGAVKDPRTLTLEVEDVRLLRRGIALAVELYDGVEREGAGVPPHAPLYGKRDRLVELARQLDHTANCGSNYVGEFELHGDAALRSKRVEVVDCGCQFPAVISDAGTCSGCGAQVIRTTEDTQ